MVYISKYLQVYIYMYQGCGFEANVSASRSTRGANFAPRPRSSSDINASRFRSQSFFLTTPRPRSRSLISRSWSLTSWPRTHSLKIKKPLGTLKNCPENKKGQFFFSNVKFEESSALRRLRAAIFTPQTRSDFNVSASVFYSGASASVSDFKVSASDVSLLQRLGLGL